MVFSLAPKAIRKLLFPVKRIKVSRNDTKIWVVKQLPRVRSADSLSPFPMKIEALGAPPLPTNAAKADTIMIRYMANVNTIYNVIQHVDDLGSNGGKRQF